MAPGRLIFASLCLVFGWVVFRNDLPIAYRKMFNWVILAAGVAVVSFFTGLALREAFQRSYVYLLLAASIPIVAFAVMSTAIRLVERRLNRPVELMVNGGEDRYLSIAIVLVFCASAGAIGLLLRHAP
jgi:uncharacterized membrane protein